MVRPPTIQHRPRKVAAICAAAVVAALFTPVPATADVIERPRDQAKVGTATVALPAPDTVALLLISTGMIGIGLSMGGLVIVTHRRKQW
jgi:hypothetical protein